MGLFSKPKCPHCGGPITETGYSFPFPAYRCRNCIKRNSELKELSDRIKKLEAQNESTNKGKKD